jgi:small conductance mechanosensitive channel
MKDILSLVNTSQRDALLLFGLNLTVAIGIFTAGWVFGSILGNWIEKVSRERSGPTVAPLLGTVVRVGLKLIATVAALSKLGIDTSSLLAVVGAAGLAIGLALKDTLSDLASGVILLLLRPFEVGDAVDISGKAGVVTGMNLFHVDLTTSDGVPLMLSNSSVKGAPIMNYSRAKVRRTELRIGIGYDADVGKALGILTEMLSSDVRVLTDPAPLLNVDALGESSVVLLVRYHCAAADFLDLKMDMTRRSKEFLEAAGIQIPFHQREVRVVGAPLSAA